MGKHIAPTYSVWDLCTLSPYPLGSHYVITERTDDATLITDQQIVVDYGSQEKRDPAIAEAARKEERRLNQASFDEHIKGRKFDRFVVGYSYVTVIKEDVARLAGIFDTPIDQIKITVGVEILHRTGEWIFWSDGKFTTTTGISLPSGGSISSAAASLISAVRGSDGGSCGLPGGLRKLADVVKIISEENVKVGPSRGHYARERIERIAVEWNDGTQGEFYTHTAGYFEGYMYDIYPSLDALKAQIAPAPGAEGISTFPADDYDYDPQLGYVAKQED